MNGKQITVLAGLAICAALTGWMLKSQTTLTDDYDISEHGPDLFIEGVHLRVMGEDGSLRNLIEAENLKHYPHADHSILTLPVMHIFEESRKTWQVASERGQVATSGEEVWLLGRVEIRRNEEPGARPLRVLTRDLRIWPENKTAATDSTTVIESDRYRIEAVGMDADFVEKRLELRSRVRGRIDVAG